MINSSDGRPRDLLDQHGRQHTYLRISVTDRCNLRCRYCMPREGVELKPRSDLLTFEEIEQVATIFAGLGVRKIRLTGGEPLVRIGIEDLCANLSRIEGVEELAVSTNGILMEEKAVALRKAGVTGVNISLDTLEPRKFQHITLRATHEAVLKGIQAARSANFPSLKINTVVMKGFNDGELLDFVEFAIDQALNFRFIEYMPFLGNQWDEARLMPYREMKGMIERRHRLIPVQPNGHLVGPAREFHVDGTNAIIGFVSTMTDEACSTCNRLRLTADGKLRNCLFAFEDLDLRSLLRACVRKEAVEAAIRSSVFQKWEKRPEVHELVARQNYAMVSIGG